MPAKVRRIDRDAISPFEWHTGGAHAPSSAPSRSVVDSPADPQVHQLTLANLEREAFAKGFAQGERAGAEAAAKRGEAMLRRLTQTLEEITGLREQMIRQTEEQMVRLALAVARRVVHREVTLDKDLLIAMARVALDRLGESARVAVRLNPEDFQATVGAQSAAWSGTHVTVVADARVARGGCRIDSDFGALDAGVDAQIQELAHALLGDAVGVIHGGGR
jgi:flagellar assembly protein FliH